MGGRDRVKNKLRALDKQRQRSSKHVLPINSKRRLLAAKENIVSKSVNRSVVGLDFARNETNKKSAKKLKSLEFLEKIEKTKKVINTERRIKVDGKAFATLDSMHETLDDISKPAINIIPHANNHGNELNPKRNKSRAKLLTQESQVFQALWNVPEFKQNPTGTILTHLKNTYNTS